MAEKQNAKAGKSQKKISEMLTTEETHMLLTAARPGTASPCTRIAKTVQNRKGETNK